MNEQNTDSVETASAVANAEPKAGRNGISLASLFVITTAAAVLVSGIAPVGQHLASGQVGLLPVAIALGCGALAGLVLGLILGMHRYHRGWGALLGGSIGTGLGLIVGPLVLLPVDLLRPVATAMFIGSVLIVAVAIVMRPGLD